MGSRATHSSVPAVSDGWQPLGDAPGRDVVLAVDFESARPDRGLTGLLAPFADRVPMLRLRADGLLVGPTGADLVAAWVATLRRTGLRPRSVFGYCAGGAPACAIADALGADAPSVILLDPEVVTDLTIAHELGAALSQLADFLPPEDRDRAVEEARRTCAEQDGAALVETLVRQYRNLARPGFGELDLDPEVAEALCARLASYLVFLVAARSLGYPSRPVDRLLLSVDHGLPAGVRGAMERFPVDRADLLSHPAVRAAASAAVEAAGT